eukprot:1158614-Pelagomonas_calceolata.AAC.5
MRGMAEGEAIVAYREGVCMCPKDLVTATCAEVGVVGTVKFKRVKEPGEGELSTSCMITLRMWPWTCWQWGSGYSVCFLIWWSEERLSVAMPEWP